MNMRVTFLGTGTSHGIPVIGCDCPVCTSKDPHDRRFRSSVLIEKNGKKLIIDTGYELRLQLLRANVKSLDLALYTHAHADHISGIDDLRVFSKKHPFPVYSDQTTYRFLKDHFSYAISPIDYPGTLKLSLNVLEPCKTVNIEGFSITPVPLLHGKLEIFGYRIDDLGYLTDVSEVPELSLKALDGIKILIIGALREKPHHTHFSFSQAVVVADKLDVKEVYFTHINHETCYSEINERYKGRAKSAYDDLVFDI